MKWFVIVIGLIALTGCVRNNAVKDEAGNVIYYIDPKEGPGHITGKKGDYYIHDSVPFFGKFLLRNDMSVLRQIKEIAEEDSVLSYDGKVLKVHSVEFGINIWGGDVYLYSSTPAEDSDMQRVIEYLDKIYGNGQFVEANQLELKFWSWHVSHNRSVILGCEGNGTELEFYVVTNWCGNARLHPRDRKFEIVLSDM